MILVTGATGLVGSHLLVKLLEENEVVRALYRNKEKIEAVKTIFDFKNKIALFDKIHWVKGDILDIPTLEIAFEGVSEVYHCAALVSFDPNDEEVLRKTNIDGTANIVNCCIDFKVSKLCHVSSVAALGEGKEKETLLTEDTEWNPENFHNDYAISKYGAEMEVWRGYQEGLKVVIVNPGVIFGFGFPKKGSSALFNSVKKGVSFYTKGKLAVVAVEDVVNCMQLFMQNNIFGERFTIVAKNPSVEEVLNIIAEAMHVKKPFIYANKTLTGIAWRVDWLLSKITGRKRKFTKATAKGSHSPISFSNTKIKKHLHYEFLNMKDYLTTLSQCY